MWLDYVRPCPEFPTFGQVSFDLNNFHLFLILYLWTAGGGLATWLTEFYCWSFQVQIKSFWCHKWLLWNSHIYISHFHISVTSGKDKIILLSQVVVWKSHISILLLLNWSPDKMILLPQVVALKLSHLNFIFSDFRPR